MRVSVRILGGLFDDDRTVSIDQRELTVAEKGAEPRRRQLAPGADGQVNELARVVASLDLPSAEAVRAVDGGSTTIEISEDDVKRTIVVAAGEDPPEPVWALLDSVEALTAEDG